MLASTDLSESLGLVSSLLKISNIDCLALARFVPFAIFVCSSSMFIIIVLSVDLIFFKPSSSDTRSAWSSAFFFEIGILSLRG